MKRTILLLLVLSLVLGGCTGAVDNTNNNVPSPPSLPEETEPINEKGGNLQPPVLPEE